MANTNLGHSLGLGVLQGGMGAGAYGSEYMRQLQSAGYGQYMTEEQKRYAQLSAVEQSRYAAQPPSRKKTFKDELQAETTEWLSDVKLP